MSGRTSQGGEVASRGTHDPEFAGSIPAPATNLKMSREDASRLGGLARARSNGGKDLRAHNRRIAKLGGRPKLKTLDEIVAEPRGRRLVARVANRLGVDLASL